MTFQSQPPSWQELFDMGMFCSEAARTRGASRQAAETWASRNQVKWPDGRRRKFNVQADAKCPCSIRGKHYPSISDAARAHRTTVSNIITHLNKHGHADYVGLRGRWRKGNLPANSQPITVSGIKYPSIGAAARDLKTNKQTMIDWRDGKLTDQRARNFMLKIMRRDGRIASERMREANRD